MSRLITVSNRVGVPTTAFNICTFWYIDALTAIGRRDEARTMFEELLSRFGAVRVVRAVEWTRSNRHTGIRHLVVELLEEQ